MYRKNFTLAYTRRAEPHTPITRNIGTSSASKKTKNSSRSSARNEPRIAVSSSSVRAMNSRTRWLDAPGRDDRDRRHERREHDQPDAEPVDADEVGQARRRHPVDLLDQLVAGDRGVERAQHAERDQEVASATTRATARAWRSLAPRHRREDGDPDEREEDDEGQPGHRQSPQSQEQQERDRAEQERERVRAHEPPLDPRGDPGCVDHLVGRPRSPRRRSPGRRPP